MTPSKLLFVTALMCVGIGCSDSSTVSMKIPTADGGSAIIQTDLSSFKGGTPVMIQNEDGTTQLVYVDSAGEFGNSIRQQGGSVTTVRACGSLQPNRVPGDPNGNPPPPPPDACSGSSNSCYCVTVTHHITEGSQ